MARWVCVFDDSPEMLAIRSERRAQHHDFLRRHASRIRQAGALLPQPDAPPSGALWLLDVETRDAAVALIEQDPYFDPKYRQYRLFEWKWALDYPIDGESPPQLQQPVAVNSSSDALIRRHEHSDRVLLTTADGRSWTYSDFAAATGRIANVLRKQGIKAGDRILVQVEKSPEALAFYGACLRLGAVMAPFSTTRSAGEMIEFADELAPHLLVLDKSVVARAPRHAPFLTLNTDGTGTLLERAAQQETSFDDVARAPGDLAMIMYTSGTTGRSKGCMLSHGNLLSNARALVDAWKILKSDVLLHVMPLYHIHGLLISTNAVLTAGASMLFANSFTPAGAIELLPRSTILMGTPQQYAALLETDAFGRDVASNMRLFISGGALLNSKTMTQFEDRCGHRILERHAMTELGVSASNPYEGARKCGTVGVPLPDISIRLSDHQTGELLPPGHLGVVEVKGPNVFLGYWNQPKLTARSFRHDGYFVTGDVARLDDEGYLEMLGREDDIIVSRGKRISARAIEEVLDAAPGVQESAVIGVAHPELGEAILGIVVARHGETPAERGVLAYAASCLEADCCPAGIVFVDRLPRNSTGKLEKRILRRTYRGLYAEDRVDA